RFDQVGVFRILQQVLVRRRVVVPVIRAQPQGVDPLLETLRLCELRFRRARGGLSRRGLSRRFQLLWRRAGARDDKKQRPRSSSKANNLSHWLTPFPVF